MTVKLSSLRIVADLDAAPFKRGAADVDAASGKAASGVSQLGNAITTTERRAERASGEIHKLSVRFVDGFGSAYQFEKAVKSLGRAFDSGNISIERADKILLGLHKRYGLTANAQELAAKGQHDLAGAVTRVNALLDQQGRKLHSVNDNLASFRRGNLRYQLFDIGQGLAGGLNPAMIAAQQGPQILQLYAGAGGVNAALRDTMGIVGGLARSFGPVAVAAAIAAAGIAGAQHEIAKATGVAVSFGDVAGAAMQLASDAIYTQLQPAIKAVSPWFEAAWQQVIVGVKWAGNEFVKGWLTTFETLRHGVAVVPPLFKIAGEAAANGMVAAFEFIANEARKAFNAVITGANNLVSMVGGDWLKDNLGWNLTVKEITGEFKLGRFDLGGKQAFTDLANEAARYQQTVKDIRDRDYMGDAFSAMKAKAVERYRDRLSEAEKATAKLGSTTKATRQNLGGIGDATDAVWKAATRGAKGASDEITQTLGRTLASLFDGPIKGADQFFDKVTGGLAQLGMSNLNKLFDSTGSPANDNGRPRSVSEIANSLSARLNGLSGDVQTGTKNGFMDALKELGLNDKQAQGVGVGLSAGLGGFGLGAQTQSPGMGALGGALSGAMAGLSTGNPLFAVLGAVVGGVAGKLGGLFSRRKEGDHDSDQRAEAAPLRHDVHRHGRIRARRSGAGLRAEEHRHPTAADGAGHARRAFGGRHDRA